MNTLRILLGTNNVHLVAMAAAFETGPTEGRVVRFPEVHLGLPRPTGKIAPIADEMIACLTAGPSVVITHSDVFVLRVRRRVAEGALPHEQVEMCWVTDVDTFTPIALNEFGVPSWWPSSKFEEAVKETAALLTATGNRRRLRRALNKIFGS